MARSIPTTALAKLAETQGVESILIVAVQWVVGGSFTLYADREIPEEPSVKPAIIDLGVFDSVLAISLNETSQEVSLTLDDTDGTIKDILDNHDIHKRDAIIYQWFPGISFNDKFIVFRGKINSPILWKESDRTVGFSVLSQLEDNEVGYTLEEGAYTDNDLDDLIGKTWPECFGTTLHQKPLQIDSKNQGTLADGFGIADFTIPAQIGSHGTIVDYLTRLAEWANLAASDFALRGMDQEAAQALQIVENLLGEISNIEEEMDRLNDIYQEQLATERTTIRILGGEKFPRGPITLDISGALLSGNFGSTADVDDDLFYIGTAIHPERSNYPEAGPALAPGIPYPKYVWTIIEAPLLGNPKMFPRPDGWATNARHGLNYIFTGEIIGDVAGVFDANAGVTVKVASSEAIRYIVSITRGYGGMNDTGVLKVTSFKTLENGERVMLDVPTDLYTAYRQRFGSVTATIVRVHEALSKVEPRPWEDNIYVTFQSTVGPNTVDILAYLITRYTSFAVDQPSFNHVRSRVANYPMHFVFPGRKNIFMALQEIAFQARCAIYLRNGKFFLQYLPEQPASVHTFTDSNVDTASVEMGFTETEDLITKFIGTWEAHGAQEEQHRCILRYNIKKYGTHEFTFDYYAYNLLDLVIKSMTYWIIRRGNTWKMLSFDAALDALNVETFDGTTLDFSNNYTSAQADLGVIEKADYDSDNNTIAFTVWTGVRAGEMDAYDFAYPADQPETLLFPSVIEEAEGNAGGGGVGQDTGGTLNRKNPLEEFRADNMRLIGEVGGNRRNSDKGAPSPTDVGDTRPADPSPRDTGELIDGPIPPPTPSLYRPNLLQPTDIFSIDIRETSVIDSQNPGQAVHFDTFFKQIAGLRLQGDTEAIWADTDYQGQFDFKWDEEDEEWGAGTAFLEEDE